MVARILSAIIQGVDGMGSKDKLATEKVSQKTIDGLIKKGLIERVGHDPNGNPVYQNTQLGNQVADALEKTDKFLEDFEDDLDDDFDPFEMDIQDYNNPYDDEDDDNDAYNDIEWDEY